jgi:hypothetical protein
MAREAGSRRLYKYRWMLSFTLGGVVGALSSEFMHGQNTFWIILFFGAVTGAVAIFEQFGEPRSPTLRTSINPARWGGRNLSIILCPRARRPASSARRAGRFRRATD